MKKKLLMFILCLLIHPAAFAGSGFSKNTAIGDWMLSLGLDNRIRYEYLSSYDVSSTDDTKSILFNRLLVNLKFSYQDYIDIFIEGLDAREGTYHTKKVGQADSFDLHQAYIELKDISGSVFSLKLGRQKLSYGNKRLLAAPTWSNKIRSFDAAVAKIRLSNFKSDLFIGNVVQYDLDNFNDGQGHEVLGGIYNTFNIGDNSLIDLYFISQIDKRSSTKERFTAGSRFNIKPAKDWEFDFEASYQFGKKAGSDIQAYALAAYAQKGFDTRYDPMLRLELNLASGDSDLSDDKYQTFIPVYQTTHAPYGIIDFVRWQNLREIALVGSLNLTEKLSIQPEFHHYWLDKDADFWYSSSGAQLGVNKTGNTDSEIGSEVSLIASYKLNNNLLLEAGYSCFFAERVAELSGEDDIVNFVYVQNILKF